MTTRAGEWRLLIPALHTTHGNEPPGDEAAPSSPASRRCTLLYSHGNAEDLGLIAPFLADLVRLLRVDVLCYDYAGYGLSTDAASVAGFWGMCGREVEWWKA